MNDTREQAVPIKILVVGEPKTGKTSFIDRYVNDRFKEEGPPVTTDFASKLIWVDDMTFSINLWDIGKVPSMSQYGDDEKEDSPQYHGVSNLFVRSANAAILTIDVESLLGDKEELESALKNALKWQKTITTKFYDSSGGVDDTAPTLKWVLAITKCDREISSEEKKMIVNRINKHLRDKKEGMSKLQLRE